MSKPLVGNEWSGADRKEDYLDYLSRCSDINQEAQAWMDDTSNTHWANYVRQRTLMAKDFLENEDMGKPGGWSMWDYGQRHAIDFGYKTNRPNSKVLGPATGIRDEMAWGNDLADFAKWHWENKGQYTDRTLRDMDAVRAAEVEAERVRVETLEREEEEKRIAEAKRLDADRAARQSTLQQMMNYRSAQQMNQAAQSAESSRLSSLRIGSSNTLGSSGAASFKTNVNRSSLKKGRGGGTNRFKRPSSQSSGLSIAGTPSTGLNIS